MQQQICLQLAIADGKAAFITDYWGKEIGEGYTMVLQDGDAIEKAAVNLSAVHGTLSAAMQQALAIKAAEKFYAAGISSIIHPHNPHAPIIHLNVRYFELSSGKAWFGGGMDLTPHYVNKKEAAWFHRELKKLCDRFDATFYPEFNKWADDYFYLPHRNETRGVGGIFFDHLDATGNEQFERLLAFTSALAEAFPQIYIHLLNENRNRPFSEQEKQWQVLRRGRYVEFNLLYDRGTRFGLESNGRPESILLSLPPLAGWTYNVQPEKSSPEAETLGWLKKGVDWLNMEADG